MKEKIVETEKKKLSDIESKKITRKEAIKKAGFIAVSAATMMILLGTPKSASASPAPPTKCEPKPNKDYHGPWKKN